MTLKDWLIGHPYLRPVAQVRARITAAAGAAAVVPPASPDWDAYRADFAAGVPLLASAAVSVNLGAIDDAIARAAESLRGRDGSEPDAGVVRSVGSEVLATALAPLIAAFDAWRDDDRWRRRYCPTCGSLPAMAQFVGRDPGRRRMLVCGCCGTRWQYGRTGCPFCEAAPHRLASVGIDGEHGLRIDYCESCHGYLKTYDGSGDEDVLLADWTSLHLDALARDRGLRRLAASLYELDADTV